MEEVVYCGMSEEQQEVYTKEKNTLRNSLLEEWHRNKIIALNGITRLRQLANHPGMIFRNIREVPERWTKCWKRMKLC